MKPEISQQEVSSTGSVVLWFPLPQMSCEHVSGRLVTAAQCRVGLDGCKIFLRDFVLKMRPVLLLVGWGFLSSAEEMSVPIASLWFPVGLLASPW